MQRPRHRRRVTGAVQAVAALAAAVAALGLPGGRGALAAGETPAAASPAASATPATPAFMNLILTASARGELLPCGKCHTKAGGLGRRATLIEACRDTADFLIVADGGDFLRPGDPDPQFDAFTVKMLADLGYSVLGVGEIELARGLDAMRELVAPHAGLEWVSCNIVDQATGEPLFAPYVFRPAGGKRVGLTSCLDPALWEDHAAGAPGIRVDPPLAALSRATDAMHDQGDYVICFMHMGERALRSLLDGFGGVDLAVASHDPSIDNYPTRMGAARQVFFAGNDGRFLNWANLTVGRDSIEPQAGRTLYLLDSVPEDPAVAQAVLDFLGVREPPGSEDDSGGEVGSGDDSGGSER